MRAVFYRVKSRRSEHLYHAWKTGLARYGVNLSLRWEYERRGIEADYLLHYGLWGSLRDLHLEARRAGAKAILIDLGYWHRTIPTKLDGYHRIAVNGLHATAYFQRMKHPADRWRYFGLQPKPLRERGDSILLCGMSEKAAWVYGLGPEQWEKQAVETLRRFTDREIRYRPKYSWKDAQPIKGTTWARSKDPIELELSNSWALVTHHGNSALDALIEGVPVFCEDGIASALCQAGLASIEAPAFPDTAARDQMLYDAAYTQYRVSEIAEGRAWRYLLEEGLV